MGDELFGTVSLTPEAHGLVERSGARSLSLGLTPDLMGIREVSLVRHPRIESAQLFSAGPVFWGELGETCVLEGEALAEAAGKVFGTDGPSPPTPSPISRDTSAAAPETVPAETGEGAPETWRRRYDQLLSDPREKEADGRLREFVAQGRLTPAQMPFARALMLASDTVAFAGTSLPAAKLSRSDREAAAAPLFGEQAPDQQPDYSAQLLLPEEAAFYSSTPEVSLDEIARARNSPWASGSAPDPSPLPPLPPFIGERGSFQ